MNTSCDCPAPVEGPTYGGEKRCTRCDRPIGAAALQLQTVEPATLDLDRDEVVELVERALSRNPRLLNPELRRQVDRVGRFRWSEAVFGEIATEVRGKLRIRAPRGRSRFS